MNENIFRAYDIRGIFGKDLTVETARDIGKAFGTYLGEGKNLIVGRDSRPSGKALNSALIEGLISVGCNVSDVGFLPSPVLYFAIYTKRKDGGVMITASHNPPEWNGFKLILEKGRFCAQETGMEQVKEIFLSKKFNKPKNMGKIDYDEKILENYSNFILSKIKLGRKLKIVIDTGNSVCSLTAPKLFKSIGCEVVAINEELKEIPARPYEPTEEALKELIETVKKEEADLGVAYDGDGDRVAFIDNNGKYVSSDSIAMLLAKPILGNRKDAKFVFNINCSSATEEFIKENGGIPIVTKTGRTFMHETMVKEKAILGGETSGHFYFQEVFSFDDATFASLKIAEIVSSSKEKFSRLIDSLPSYFSVPTKDIDCGDETKFKVIDDVKMRFIDLGYRIIDTDGVKAFKGKDWVLIRASNTMPKIKVNAESETRKGAEEIFGIGMKILEEEIGKFKI
jgi:phosphomannomutase/phosphoglucomutase